MVTYALDYSAGRPTGAQVAAAGYRGVIRYIGFPSNRKCLTGPEFADMTAHGIGVSLVYEQNAGDALLGRAAGQVSARRALAHATALGYPVTRRPIYYAVDTDIVTEAQFVAVLDYLRGACDVHGGPEMVGVYGEYDVMERAERANVAHWRWQTRAWSGGRLCDTAHLRQEIGTYMVGGIACDRSTILAADWGQTGLPLPEEDELPTPEDLWNAYLAWPEDVTDVPHLAPGYSAARWLVTSNTAANAALTQTRQITAALATLAAQVAALAALVQQPGKMTGTEAHQIALDAAKEALDELSPAEST